MVNNKQVYMVSESDPKPDNYIAIFCKDKNSNLKKLGYSAFSNINDALNRAKILQSKYGAKQLRLFLQNSVSIVVKGE